MKFDKDALGPALKVWRESQRWSAKDVAKCSETESARAFSVATVHKWEKGNNDPKPKKPVYPSFDRLVDDILPAYKITSLDQFLVFYCNNSQPEVNTVRHIPQARLNKDEKLGVLITYADPKWLGPEHPFRVDTITVPANEASIPASHKGYNYLMVVDGKVESHFTDAKNQTKTLKLAVGDAVAFHTALQHYIRAIDGSAKVVVARPTWAAKPNLSEE